MKTAGDATEAPSSRIEALNELAARVEASDAFFDAASRESAPSALTALVRRLSSLPNPTDDDCAVLDAAAAAIAACSGHAARGSRSATLTFGVAGTASVDVRITEGALGDGLGMRLWPGAFALCNELCAARAWVAGRAVLELGAGTGLAGIVGAKLGAASVCLTDFEAPVLANLAACVRANCAAEEPGPDASDWDSPGMSVRHLDWRAERDAVRSGSAAALERYTTAACPSVEPGATFSRVLAADVLYDMGAARDLPYAVARRMAPGGACLVCGPVRQHRVFEAFVAECRGLGLRVGWVDVAGGDTHAYQGVRPRGYDYEGGWKLVGVDHADAPCAEWHRAFDFSRDDHVKACPCQLCAAAERIGPGADGPPAAA
ncbi:unnamed protein product [Pedinophyceae sp. YPF-701]|nr:unnamed protein product [Pedinophyceae sp. YPF-701]